MGRQDSKLSPKESHIHREHCFQTIAAMLRQATTSVGSLLAKQDEAMAEMHQGRISILAEIPLDDR
jgi:flagellar hook-basal body complex protein FliE